MLQPKYYTAHILKGVALSLGDRMGESEQSFKEAIRLDPRRLEGYNGEQRVLSCICSLLL